MESKESRARTEAWGQSMVASPAHKSLAGVITLTLLWRRELLMLLIWEAGEGEERSMHLQIQWRCKLRSAVQPAFVHMCVNEKNSTVCDNTSLHVSPWLINYTLYMWHLITTQHSYTWALHIQMYQLYTSMDIQKYYKTSYCMHNWPGGSDPWCS